jgi:hypothetical protein
MNSRPRTAFSRITTILALAGTSAVVASVIGARAGGLTATGSTFTAIAVSTLLAPLFWPRKAATLRQLLGCVITPIIAGTLLAGAFAAARIGSMPMGSLAPVLAVALGILVVAYLCMAAVEGAMRQLGADEGSAREASVWCVVAILWLSSAAPLWLGPIADLGARGEPGLPSAVLAASPLVHLAIAGGYDLLRSQWFYGHSSLGALQVEYPRVATLLACYAAAGAVLALLAIPLRIRPKDTALVEPRIAQGERHS